MNTSCKFHQIVRWSSWKVPKNVLNWHRMTLKGRKSPSRPLLQSDVTPSLTPFEFWDNWISEKKTVESSGSQLMKKSWCYLCSFWCNTREWRTDGQMDRRMDGQLDTHLCSHYRAVKCRLIWHFRGQALLLRVLHVVACDNVRDCVFLKDDLNRVKKGLNSYELNFSLPTNSQNKLTELN